MAWQGNGMGAAWERHGVCELAFNVFSSHLVDKPVLLFHTREVQG
jgi:hypothetical protein